ncbi:MAG: aspartate 1-decarboxylase [Gemmataceae bacterium]
MSADHGPVVPRLSMLKSKLHRLTVTHADVDYEGSLTLDRTLMDAAHILPWEEVHVWNVTRGTRLRTYAMEADPGTGIVCVNGAAAHLCKPGDLIIVATYTLLDEHAARQHRPRIVLVGANNRITRANGEMIPGPHLRTG